MIYFPPNRFQAADAHKPLIRFPVTLSTPAVRKGVVQFTVSPGRVTVHPTTMQKAEKKLNIILKKSQIAGISSDKLIRLKVLKHLDVDYCLIPWAPFDRRVFKLVGALVILYFIFSLTSVYKDQCLLEMPLDSSKVFRKSEDCKMCHGVTQVQRVKNISQEEFEDLYAHTAVPVIVTDGAVNWPAVENFNFEFFKQLYNHDDEENSDNVDECQFFPYKTEFKSLREVFNMSETRSKLEPGTKPWYIGWSNCNNKAGEILRKFYSRPYFLPENSENIALSWIFMGGPGNGAHMHVDNVVHPSWQAQLSGRKVWRLMPPPECIYQCTEISVTVHPAEIIVVDTNKWYHQTTILDGEVSITIGSEFD